MWLYNGNNFINTEWLLTIRQEKGAVMFRRKSGDAKEDMDEFCFKTYKTAEEAKEMLEELAAAMEAGAAFFWFGTEGAKA